MNARSTTTVDVHRGDARIGELERTQHGARFRYDDAYLKTSPRADEGAALSMPPRAEPYEVFGTNLHPFFAGLLPEGLRLRALVRAVKTSQDDLFSLLVASGADTVGDIAIAPKGQPVRERAPVADIAQLANASFQALLEESLRYEDERGDVSVAGVQPKVSAAMISFPVRARTARRAYLLKLTPADYPRLVENEAFFMSLAKSAGLIVAATAVVHDREGQSALLVERFDRAARGQGALHRLHQEDACQLLDRYPADKYRLTLRDVADALEVCSAPVAERLKLLRLQAYSYLIGNGDMHGKNVSVRMLSGRIELTPCYDLLSTLPYGDAKLALAIDGRDANLKRAHFVTFGERIGLRRAAVVRMLEVLSKRVAKALPRLAEIGLPAKRAAQLEREMTRRLTALAG